jgi:hypothetical protein
MVPLLSGLGELCLMAFIKTEPATGDRGLGGNFQQTGSSCAIAQTTPEKQDPLVDTDGRPDPRLVFLERASARLILFEACLLDLDEAFEGLFQEPQKRGRP